MIDTIVNSFDIWTNAQGIKSRTRINSIENISLEGISRLRELILRLAIMGKLVPQDKTEEHASKLLDQINAEKNIRIKRGIIKNDKSLLPIQSNEIPYLLPDGWVWCRLGDISILINGDRGKNYPSKAHYIEKGIPFITAANLGDRFLKYDSLNYISEDRYALLRSGQVEPNDILYCLRGSLGKSAIVDRINKGAIASSLCIVRSFPGINYTFLLNYFLSPLGKEMIKRHDNGTAQPNLSATDVKTYVFPLPPFTEQKRIVAKVDELMALCDKLEEEQFNNLKTHQVLVKTLLETLTQAADANKLQAAWDRMSAHFDTLFCTEDSIDQLKQTILQLAVMGKLVKQNSNDEPASELLKKIAKEKEKLIDEGKIKNQSILPEIKDNEKLFELPKSWVWCRLQDLISLLGDGIHGTPEYEENGEYYFVNGNNLSNGIIEIKSNTKTVTEKEYQLHKRELNERTILVSINGTIGNTAFYNNEKIILGKSACYFNLLNKIEKEYIRLIITSKYFLDYAFSEATGTTIQNVSLRTMRSLVIPLPPFNEQQKIIQKVQELFSICDKLSLKIIESQNIKVQLSKTIVEKAVQ